jgi:antirestriction protein
MAREIDNSQDILDVRDIIARVESLEDTIPQSDIDNLIESEGATELVALRELLGDLAGNGGDEEWGGDWYPVTLIRDSYFKDYAMELADDIGAVDNNARWPMTCIDWNQAARELRMDYSSVEFDGVTYWYR